MDEKKIVEYTIGWKPYIYYADPGKDALQKGIDIQKISFVLAEGFYNHCMQYVKYMETRNSPQYSEGFWEGYKQACVYWLHWAREFCDDYPPKMRKPTKKEQKEFKYVEELENGEKFEWPLIGIIDYRGDKLPVYDDDNGQCYFCKLPDGRCVSGGGWNPDPEDEFCFEYDEYLNHHEGR